jgi:hypothetical protein
VAIQSRGALVHLRFVVAGCPSAAHGDLAARDHEYPRSRWLPGGVTLMQRSRRADDRMPREWQLLLGSEDPRWHPAGPWLELSHDQLELPHLYSECDQRLSPDPRRVSEEHDQIHCR